MCGKSVSAVFRLPVGVPGGGYGGIRRAVRERGGVVGVGACRVVCVVVCRYPKAGRVVKRW